MSKKNRKNNRRQQNNAPVVQSDPFVQFLNENYANVLSEAQARYAQMLTDEQMFVDMDTIRNEWAQADAAVIALQQKQAAQAAVNAKAAKVAAEAARRESERRNKVATLKARVAFVGICSIPMAVAILSLINQSS